MNIRTRIQTGLRSMRRYGWTQLRSRPPRLWLKVSDAGYRFIEHVAGKAQSAAAQLRVKSALNPMLWLCGIISLPCFAFAWFVRGVEPLASVLTYVGAAPVIVACLMGMFFAIFKPEKLQSEDYQLRHETLELIRQKGSNIEIEPSSLEIVANPVSGALK